MTRITGVSPRASSLRVLLHYYEGNNIDTVARGR